jgi:transglutaminase-like putative cysteine protease
MGNTAAATVISKAGVLSIAADETASTVTIKATSAVDAAKTKTAVVTLWNPGEAPENSLTVTSLVIYPRHNISGTHIAKGGSLLMYATINDSAIVTQNVTWSFYQAPNTTTYPLPECSGTTFAASGLLTIAPDEPPKSFHIQATYTLDATIYARGTVTVWESDSEKELLITPVAPQETFVGAPARDQVKVHAQVRHFAGTVTETLPGITYSGNGAPYVNQTTGIFEPTSPGTYTVTAHYEGQSVTSGTITVHSADYLRQPYHYSGTNTTYQGYQGAISYSGPVIADITAQPLISQNEIALVYPSVTTFDADRFFPFEAARPGIYKYVMVTVVYLDGLHHADMPSEYYYYFSDTTIKERIWLRYGAGLYSIEIKGYTPSPVSGGDIHSFCAELYVNNTRNESSLSDEVDRRYLFPSPKIQSDSLLVSNIVKRETSSSRDTVEKVRALHDYLIVNTDYDWDYYQGKAYRGQDAISVLSVRYLYSSSPSKWNFPDGHLFAICEGYSFATAALLRASGIEVRNAGNDVHLWNNVYVNGGWKFLDVTWDDHTPISYKYFLLSDLGGGNSEHQLPSGMSEFIITPD